MNKNDNQQIAAKVAKIKEVVRGVSNEDITLALYSFDLNVERTIQAFCEDGASGVLDDWVRPAGTGGKKNKKKGKSAAPAAAAPIAPKVVEQPKKVAPTPAPVAAPVAAPAPKAAAPKAAAPAKPSTNGVAKVNKEAEKQPSAPKATGASAEKIQSTFKTLRNVINEREKVLLSSLQPQSSFSADLNQLVAFINSFGVVHDSSKPATSSPAKSASPVQVAAIKHATSQSSISSSVGADSGVNLSPVHSEQKKVNPKSVLSCGGIQMSSEGLSADQLAAIKQSLEERLAASGFDASVFSGAQNVRRPKKANENRGKQQKDSSKNAQRPKLSILNA